MERCYTYSGNMGVIYFLEREQKASPYLWDGCLRLVGKNEEGKIHS